MVALDDLECAGQKDAAFGRDANILRITLEKLDAKLVLYRQDSAGYGSGGDVEPLGRDPEVQALREADHCFHKPYVHSINSFLSLNTGTIIRCAVLLPQRLPEPMGALLGKGVIQLIKRERIRRSFFRARPAHWAHSPAPAPGSPSVGGTFEVAHHAGVIASVNDIARQMLHDP